ncbi:RNA polymerase sigma factor [Antarcticibacterium arcticum]|uniref:RNA polymerase sigma factor n=1 Tax=Antarcticibacterium arcticum TaxID=2585771 RepID=A0A5B8YJF4_9FLAO|nr:RNA polymerase sigma factor [Antarcticibacterium arcticum]QED37855.1 RNA polymerase sigma factor [Antarcticibacterium arcticum]
MSLEKLIHRCTQQDIKAQEWLYREYSGKLFTLCLKYSGSYEEAKDNLQDSFLKIFENISQYSGKGTFEGWITRITINTALKKAAKPGVFLTLIEEVPNEPEIEVDDEIVSGDFLIEIIQELPDRYRHVFNLHSMEGYTHKEIAVMLNISEGTSKSNLARARAKLKERIETYQNSRKTRLL